MTSDSRRIHHEAERFAAPVRSLLCAITLTSYWNELRGSKLVWEKTEKIGEVRARRS